MLFSRSFRRRGSLEKWISIAITTVDARDRHPHMRRIWPAPAGSWPARRCLKRADFRTASGRTAPPQQTGHDAANRVIWLRPCGAPLPDRPYSPLSRHRHRMRRATSRPHPRPPRASITAGPSARRPRMPPGSRHPPPHAPQEPPCARRTAGPSAPASAAGRTASGRCTGGSRGSRRTPRR